MSRFGGTDILGGVTVFIGADLEALRSGVGEARRIATDAERTISIRVPLTIGDNGARLGLELSRVMSAMQTMASSRPIRIPVILEPVGGGGMLPGGGNGGGAPMLGGGSRMARPGEITIGGPAALPGGANGGQRMLPGPSSRGVGGNQTASSIGTGGTATIGVGSDDVTMNVSGGGIEPPTPPVGWTPVGAAGGGGGRPGGGGGTGLNRGLRALFIAHAAAQALNTAADIAEYQRLSQIGTLEEAEAARVKAVASIRSIPIAGTAGAAIGTLANDLGTNFPINNASGGSLAAIRMLRTGVARLSGKMTDEEDEQARRDQERADRVAEANFANRSARSSRFISLRDQTRAANETIGMSTTGRGVFEAGQALSDFNASVGGGQLKGVAKEARQELENALANAIRQDVAAAASDIRSASINAAGITLGGNVAMLNVTGGTAIGARAGLVGGVGLANAQISNSIQTLLDQGIPLGDSRVVALRLQQGAQQAAGQQQIQAHDINDIRDFERRNTDFGIRQLRRTAERIGNISDVNDIEISQRHTGAIRAAEDTYGVNSRDAQRAREERDQEQGDTRRARLEQEGRSRRRAAHNRFIDVPREQAEIDRRFSVEMGTRTSVANAEGGNEPTLARIIPVIAGMKEEMRQVRVDQRPALAATQTAELTAMRNQLLRPTQYATEGDRKRDVPGGPGGETGKDLIEAMKALTRAIEDTSSGGSGGFPT